jgi:hypothetical protein
MKLDLITGRSFKGIQAVRIEFGTLASFTIKTGHHDIAEILLLTVALNTINQFITSNLL